MPTIPFTTKFPNLGIVSVGIDRSFVLADIPGLIEGASEGVGLGHDFLRHIMRAGILVHLVEPMPMDGSDPISNYHAIRKELCEYSDELANRPEIVAVSKAELPGSDEVHQALQESIGKECFFISAVTGSGLNRLVGRIVEQLDEHRKSQKPADRDPRRYASHCETSCQPTLVTPSVTGWRANHCIWMTSNSAGIVDSND